MDDNLYRHFFRQYRSFQMSDWLLAWRNHQRLQHMNERQLQLQSNKNKFTNLKCDRNPKNRLLQIEGEFWNAKKSTVWGDNKRWDEVAKAYKKFKVCSSTKFSQLNEIFKGCIKTPCKFVVMKVSPANVQFNTQMYAAFFKGGAAEINAFISWASTHLNRSASTFTPHRRQSSRASLHDVEMQYTVVRCMTVQEDDDPYKKWKVIYVWSTSSNSLEG